MSDMEMTTLPPQYSMSESSPMSQSGYELVSLMGADNTSAQWQVVGDDSQMLLARRRRMNDSLILHASQGQHHV